MATGSSLLIRERDRVLAPLSSVDGSIEINKGRRGDVQEKNNGKQIKAISAGG